MSDEILSRFDRIVAILTHLQSVRVVKAQELADRFQVSLRTIYRDIRSLEASGVPISGEAGLGYSITDGYRLPPVMFTREEAGSFVAAEKLMQKFTDKTLRAYHESAMYKVKSVLKNREKDWVAALESQVWISPAQQLFNENIPDALEIVLESIATKKQTILNYLTFHSEEPTERCIEPVGLFHENNHWYVMGYCHLRKDYRQFRTDRMVKIKRSDLPFTQAHKSLEELRNQEQPHGLTRVRIRVDKHFVKYIKNGRKYYGYVSEESIGEKVEMTFMTHDLEDGMARWYLMFGDFAEIIEPESLKLRVKDILSKIGDKL